MPITVTTAMPTSFKVELFRAVHNFTASTGDTFKMALMTAVASGTGTYGAATTSYNTLVSNGDELPNGNGYGTGGGTLVSVTPVASGTAGICDFDNFIWTNSTFTTCGGIIYNSSVAGNPACGVFSFGGDQQVNSGDFMITFPSPNAATAVIRIT